MKGQRVSVLVSQEYHPDAYFFDQRGTRERTWQRICSTAYVPQRQSGLGTLYKACLAGFPARLPGCVFSAEHGLISQQVLRGGGGFERIVEKGLL